MTLTMRDLDLLRALTSCVRILSIAHVMAIWWPDACNQRTARHWLGMLRQFGWIERYTVNAHPPLSVTRPLFIWKPEAPAPDVERISHESKSRWSQPARPTEVYVASPLAACLLGSTARKLPPPEHRDHDLRLAAVYTHYRKHHPRLSALWVGEHVLPKAGYRIKDPDAFLRDKHGRVIRVVESAGRYSAAQVESFHEHCVENDLSYELW